MNPSTTGALADITKQALDATYKALEEQSKPLEFAYKNLPTLNLLLFHGRKNPDEDMEDWGFDAPLIRGITSMSCTYGNLRFHFVDEAAYDAALAQTGWQRFDRNCLLATHESDMIETNVGGDKSYYGDFHLSYER